jgi:cell division protein FtsZ
MISYSRESQETIPSSAVKIVGLGGAGANMLERIALDGLDGAELLALNTDIRTLDACLAKEKVQLGVNLTKGLGTGGDPELGQQAVLEAENEVREALKGQRIVFLCTGLGGGTGSGAAPIVSRIAREEGAFVVVFATMPFFFEGRRRREQAETSLNQLAVLSNALVTFDNNRMGELVLAKQGIHEAFGAADRMISESIKAVIRLVVRPGLINVGLDDLMSALRTTRSRCLFGSGIADGKDRASKALRNALSSPLLDQGSLLKEAQTVLVHLSGGESLTLYEIELLMRSLQKHVPEQAHVLFGAAIDPAMGDNLSITLISALPEDALAAGARDSISFPEAPAEVPGKSAPKPEIENPFNEIDQKEIPQPEADPETTESAEPLPDLEIGEELDESPAPEPRENSIPEPRAKVVTNIGGDLTSLFGDMEAEPPADDNTSAVEDEPEDEPEPEERPFAEFVVTKPSDDLETDVDDESEPAADEPEEAPSEVDPEDPVPKSKLSFTSKARGRSDKKNLWGKSKTPDQPDEDDTDTSDDGESSEKSESPDKSSLAELKLDPKHSGGQSELAFDSAPRGRFEGENPNVVDGEDLDLPPFLRKKKS